MPTVDITVEYQRVRDLCHKVRKFDLRSLGADMYKTEDDLASEIFLALFERGFWDNWDSTRMSLSSYTFMGVKSLIGNARLSRQRKIFWQHGNPVAAPNFEFGDASDATDSDDSGVVGLVSTEYLPDQEATYQTFVDQFSQYVADNGFASSYTDVFALLAKGYNKTDIRDCFYPDINVFKIVSDIKELIKDYLGWDSNLLPPGLHA